MYARLEDWLARNMPGITTGLPAGASDAELERFATRIDAELPEDFPDLYRWHNGRRRGPVASFRERRSPPMNHGLQQGHGGHRHATSGFIRNVLAMLVLLAPIGSAQAEDLCADITHLIKQTDLEFAGIIDGQSTSGDVTLILPGAEDCAVTRQSNTSSYWCTWRFPYRAREAYGTFERFVGEVQSCIGERATLHIDKGVNHPDYYAARRFRMERTEVAVSVKDKAALGSTFVFVRVHVGTGD